MAPSRINNNTKSPSLLYEKDNPGVFNLIEVCWQNLYVDLDLIN